MDWAREIDELHAFFAAWFRGTVDSMERMEGVLAPGFTIVGPDGATMSRTETLAAVRAGHGRSPDLEITTSDHRLIATAGVVIVARYVETHDRPDASSRRVSTVVFTADSGAPNGVRWVSVHETWLDRSG